MNKSRFLINDRQIIMYKENKINIVSKKQTYVHTYVPRERWKDGNDREHRLLISKCSS